ncbi:MAG: UDP-N-acetylmuramoyl-tripeptide--D-alanyl-D-alanine ligase [Burkholderiaceae bacterium]|nr:UDP-N-acetylmuramoyl-tripeptide--D-alanyl-D-alanine ligase [Burkholderiaceae bacterium]
MFELREAFGWLSSGCLYGDGAIRIGGVSTDTRSIAAGDLFVALRGERFDAHDFLGQAQASGAAAVVFERWVPGIRVAAIRVPDSRRALGEVARGWRGRFDLPLVTVAGANGKTTVKEMVSAILAGHFGEAQRLATRGNLNNDVGVPLTLLRLRATHRAAVVEVGTNHPGEIAWLASVARPTVALVTNAQREHQEFLHGVEGSARENGASIAVLGADGVAVFPGDDTQAPIWRELAGARRCVEFGLDDGAVARYPVRAAPGARPDCFVLEVAGRQVEVRLAIDGAHNVRNALAAAACGHALGIDADAIAAGLARFRPAMGRLARLRGAGGAALIDDSYNANPDSVRAAIDALAACEGHRVLVLGDMGEVGEQGPLYHREVGAYARERGVERLLALGEATRDSVDAFGPGAEHFGAIEPLVERARALCEPGATVLVKGSRFMAMERVVAALAGAPSRGHH